MAEEIHHLYCAQYLKDHGEPYWTNGDYALLNERTKEYDRNIARFLLACVGRTASITTKIILDEFATCSSVEEVSTLLVRLRKTIHA